MQELGREHTVLLSTHILSEVEACARASSSFTAASSSPRGRRATSARMRQPPAVDARPCAGDVEDAMQRSLNASTGVAKVERVDALASEPCAGATASDVRPRRVAATSESAGRDGAMRRRARRRGLGVREVRAGGRLARGRLRRAHAGEARATRARRRRRRDEGFWPIYKRELFAFFVTPLAWVLIVVFLVVQGMHFFLARRPLLERRRASPATRRPAGVLRQHRPPLPRPLPPRPPMTMRLFAEERRSGTIETLMTAPGLERGGRAREVRRRAHDVRRDVGADGALPRHPRARPGTLDWHAAASATSACSSSAPGTCPSGLCASALTQRQFLALV